jgi:glycosyltransferase involved in cell wall biosynthesis
MYCSLFRKFGWLPLRTNRKKWLKLKKDKPKIFYLFSDIERRRRVFESPSTDSGERYILWGMEDFQQKGFRVDSNLDVALAPGYLASQLGTLLNKTWTSLGGYGGDFATVFKSISRLNQADLVFSTADRLGIPLVFLKMARLIKPKIIYVSIGLPERLAKLKGPVFKTLFLRAFHHVDQVICYGWGEAECIKKWLNDDGSIVRFLPIGVDETVFHPMPDVTADVDVLSVGRDTNRNYDMLIQYAKKNPAVSVRIICKKGQVCLTESSPRNIEVLEDIEFSQIRMQIARAKLIALPLYENSYSGATTSLLQSMAMAKPVVVTQTSAIKNGYHLENKKNISLVSCGDQEGFNDAINYCLKFPNQAKTMGERARKTVVKTLSWNNYISNLQGVFRL